MSRDLLWLGVVSALWLVGLAVVGIEGDFPLNDDWAYTSTAQTFMETGRLVRPAWTWVPVMTHSVVGAGFAALLGFSFEALRASGVFFGWVGMLGAYALARELGAAPARAALVAGVVGLNPIYLNLSYTFMTDVPFVALVTWSLVLLARGLARPSPTALAGGIAVAVAASLSRQSGLALPIALALTLALAAPLRLRSWVLAALGLLVVGGGYSLATTHLLAANDSGGLYNVSNFASSFLINPALPFHLVKNGTVAVAYLGWFLAPLVVLHAGWDGRVRGWLALGSGVLAIFGLLAIRALELPMPPGLNVIWNFGLGPVPLEWRAGLPAAPDWIWWLGVAFGLTSGFYALGLIAASTWRPWVWFRERPEWGIMLVFCAVYLGPHIARSPSFDRYLLPVLAPLAAALVLLPERLPTWGRSRALASAALLALLGSYGVLGTRDYLEGHRVTWGLLREQVERGTAPCAIDGGFEFNSLHCGHEKWSGPTGDELLYAVAVGKTLAGHRAVESRTWSRLLPPGELAITLFRAPPVHTAPAPRD